MSAISEKGGGSFHGIKLLLCENPLPPIDEAIAAAQAEAAHSNYYTEPYSAPLLQLISERLGVPERLVHINAGSELILRQLFDRFGQRRPTCCFPRSRNAIRNSACHRTRISPSI